MSEYQSYEFVAIDRPVSAKQMAQLRGISTRAEISHTRFWNEYQRGDLKADPAKLMDCYFDAHLYSANWGTRRLMLRLPKARIDPKVLEGYFGGGHAARLTSAGAGEHLILDLTSNTEEPAYDEETQGSLATLSPLRTELMRGDLRAAYLAWLFAVQADDVNDDETEPPAPAGLAEPTAVQVAMIAFLRIDIDLVAAAAVDSGTTTDDHEPLLRWVATLNAMEKNAWLRRAVEEPELELGAELRRAFRVTNRADRAQGRRTLGELRAHAEARRTQRELAEAGRTKRAKAAAEAARNRHLSKLARAGGTGWIKLTELVETSRYDEAVLLAVDLRDLAARDGEQTTFATRFEALRKSHMRRRGFFDRWKRAEEPT